MNYRIQIGNLPIFTLNTSQLENLGEAITMFINHGFRDGETRLREVRITEVGIKP